MKPHAELHSARAANLLLGVLRRPEQMAALELPDWDRVISIARRLGVLARLAAAAERLGLNGQVPDAVSDHFEATGVYVSAMQRAVRWEVNRVQRVLVAMGAPVVLLKGAAYVLSGLRAATGRVCRDVDILVPADRLADVERALLEHGWEIAERNPRDERYFRRWLHELPPLWHRERKIVVDVHHTILPRTDRIRLDPRLLLESASPIAGSELMTLSPPDLTLHSATHLFRNGDLTNGLRDLCDIASLLDEFSARESFWDSLLGRARQLNLTVPCFYALRYVERFLGAPVPPPVREAVQRWRPRWPQWIIKDALVTRALLPRDLDREDRGRRLSIAMLSCWPPPRVRAVATGLFWTKRLPGLAPARR